MAKSDDDVRELHDRLAVRSATVVCNLECVWPDPVAHRPLPTALDATASGPDGRVIDAGALGENITGKAEVSETEGSFWKGGRERGWPRHACPVVL